MEITKDDEFIERRILIALATSTEYLQAIHKSFRSSLLASKTARELAEWCVDHFVSYREAPGGGELNLIYRRKAGSFARGEREDIGELLQSLSDEFEEKPPNIKFLVDQTNEYLQRRSLENLKSGLDDCLPREGGVEEALELVKGFQSPVRSVSSVTDPLSGMEPVRTAFKAHSKPLIQFGHALGKFWSSQFVRDAFIAFLAPEKRGKSWLLLEIAVRATADGCNAAFFQAGDMSEQQQLIRFYTRLTNRPFPGFEGEEEEEELSNGFSAWWPELDCILNQTGGCDRKEREDNEKSPMTSEERRGFVEGGTLGTEIRSCSGDDFRLWSPCRNCSAIKPTVWMRQRGAKPLTKREAYETAQAWKERYKTRFRLSTYVNGTLSVSEIRSVLDTWEREEQFKPDVICIDYADILASDSDFVRLDQRNQINKIWQRLRALSEERKCLVVTATQAAATAYDRKGVLKLSDFSEDKRKYAHVTAMYGLNQTPDEKKLGLLRINQMVVREGDFHTGNQVHVLQALALGRPIIGSF